MMEVREVEEVEGLMIFDTPVEDIMLDSVRVVAIGWDLNNLLSMDRQHNSFLVVHLFFPH